MGVQCWCPPFSLPPPPPPSALRLAAETCERPLHARTHLGRVDILDGQDTSEDGLTSRELRRAHWSALALSRDDLWRVVDVAQPQLMDSREATREKLRKGYGAWCWAVATACQVSPVCFSMRPSLLPPHTPPLHVYLSHGLGHPFIRGCADYSPQEE